MLVIAAFLEEPSNLPTLSFLGENFEPFPRFSRYILETTPPFANSYRFWDIAVRKKVSLTKKS